MLNYTEMKHPFHLLIGILSAIIIIITFGNARAQETPPPPQIRIESPKAGEAVQGSVAVIGTSAVEGFASAELTFGYVEDTTGTWFFIEGMSQGVTSGELAVWDTTTLTDGNYNLRLVVTKTDGSQVETVVNGIRVRNYTAIETSTPTVPAPTETPAPGQTLAPTVTLTPTVTPIPPTPTSLPPNPATATSDDLTFNLLRGGLIALGIFAAAGLLFVLIRYLRR